MSIIESSIDRMYLLFIKKKPNASHLSNYFSTVIEIEIGQERAISSLFFSVIHIGCQ